MSRLTLHELSSLRLLLPAFHHDVFEAVRNNRAISRLAVVSANEHVEIA